MGVQWVGGEENGYPLVYGPQVYLCHGELVAALADAAYSLPGRCWSEYDVKRLERAVAGAQGEGGAT